MYRHSFPPTSPRRRCGFLLLWTIINIIIIINTLQLCKLNILSVSALTVHQQSTMEMPIQRVETLVRSAGIENTVPSSTLEMLEFIPTPQTLEDLIIQHHQEWWCVIFINISSPLLQQNASKYIQEIILPAVHAIQQIKKQQQQQLTQLIPSPHFAVVDMQDASLYFDLYPFAHVFQTRDQQNEHRRLDALDMLTRIEQMVREGHTQRGTRARFNTPVLLLFRPGAAVYLREGRRWTTKQLTAQNQQQKQKQKQKQQPLRMVVLAYKLVDFISEVPHKIAEDNDGALVSYLVSDYKKSIEKASSDDNNNINNNNNNKHNNNNNNNNNIHENPLGILSEEETQRHHSHLLESLQKMRERREQHNPADNPYDLDSLKGKTAKERVEEIMSRLKKNDEEDYDNNNNKDKNKELPPRQSTQMEKEEKDMETFISRKKEQGKPAVLMKEKVVEEEYIRDDL